MKKKNVFKKLVGIESGNKKWRIKPSRTLQSEKWIHHVLPADAEAPKIESERNYKPFAFIGTFCILLFAIILGRAAYVQILQGGEHLLLAEGNRIRENLIRAPRGIIYDRNHVKLVQNVPNYEVEITPNELPKEPSEKSKIFGELGVALKMPSQEIEKVVSEKEPNSIHPVIIKDNITKEESFLVSSKALKGVTVSVNPVRQYLDGGLLSHAFGYVGRISDEELKSKSGYRLTDYIGKTGLERSYENILRGKDGAEKYEVDSTGKVVKFLGVEDPQLGDSIVLGIDFELEKKLYDTMKKTLEKVKGSKASAVALDPKTGEILAFVNMPTFDNNLFSKGISDKDYNKLLNDKNNPLLPRVLAGEYPSGSSIKPFVAIGALEENLINESTTINSTGGIKVGAFSFPDWKAGGHGVTNVTKAIAESVNTFFYAIGGGYGNIKGLGPEGIKKYLTKFGFSKATGIDISGEASGSLPDPVWKEKVKNEPWYLGDSYNMSIGQGDVLVTPLQVANATVVIANGGKLLKPHFVQQIVDENDKVLEVKRPEVISEQFVGAKNLEIIKRGMRQTVTDGSGRQLKDLPIAVSGKTGSAQFGPNNSLTHGWFTSFAPYDDPKIVLTILVEGSGGGDITAVPIAKEVYEWYAKR